MTNLQKVELIQRKYLRSISQRRGQKEKSRESVNKKIASITIKRNNSLTSKPRNDSSTDVITKIKLKSQ